MKSVLKKRGPWMTISALSWFFNLTILEKVIFSDILYTYMLSHIFMQVSQCAYIDWKVPWKSGQKRLIWFNAFWSWTPFPSDPPPPTSLLYMLWQLINMLYPFRQQSNPPLHFSQHIVTPLQRTKRYQRHTFMYIVHATWLS